MGGKARLKRVVELRVKSDSRGARQRAASPRGTACPDSSHFRLPPPKFTYFTTCRYPINPTNQMADGKMKPSRLAIKTYPGNSMCFFRWRQRPTLRKSLSREKSFPVLQQVSMITVDCALASGDSIASHFIIVGIGF